MLLPAFLPPAGPIALTVVGVISIAAAIATVHCLRPQSAEPALSWTVWWPALVAPVVGAALLCIDWIRGGVAPWWVLDGDMVWNTAQSLFIHADGGVYPALHPNPAPLTNLLFAMGYGPAAEPSLGLVFGIHAVIVIVLAAGASLLSGLYLARRAADLHPFVRACLVIALAWLPFTGALLGGVFAYGHANALTSYLGLWLAWVVFSEPTLRGLHKTAILCALATVIASSWAPLVVVPAALAALTAVFAWREWRMSRIGATRDLIVALLSFAQLGAYGILITLPDLRRDSGGLSADGAAIMVGPYFMAGVVALVVCAAIVTALLGAHGKGFRENSEVALGIGAVLVLSFPVLAYMLWQRAGLPSMWGYYPVKFILLLTAVLAGVLIASIAGMISPRWGVLRQTLAALCAVPLFLSVVAPAYLSGQGWGAFAPSLVRSASGAVVLDAAATEELIRIFDADPFGEQITVGVAQDPGRERLVNNYLIQLSADRSSDEIRLFAYTLDTNNTQQLCDMIALWGDGVTVLTVPERVEPLGDQLRTCVSESAFSVEVAPTE